MATGISLRTPESQLLEFLGSLAAQARSKGIASLPERYSEIDDDFIRYALQLIVDGFDPEQVKLVLEKNVEERSAAFAKNLRMVSSAVQGIQLAKSEEAIAEEAAKA